MRVVKQVLAVVAVQGNPWLSLGVAAASTVAALVVYGWVVRRTERREVTELGGVSKSGVTLASASDVLYGCRKALSHTGRSFLKG